MVHGRLFRAGVFDDAVLKRVAARVVDLESTSLIGKKLGFGARQEGIHGIWGELGAVALSGPGHEADGDARGGGVGGEGAVLVGDREAPFAEGSEVDGSLGGCGSLERMAGTRWLAGVCFLYKHEVMTVTQWIQHLEGLVMTLDKGNAARLYEARSACALA